MTTPPDGAAAEVDAPPVRQQRSLSPAPTVAATAELSYVATVNALTLLGYDLSDIYRQHKAKVEANDSRLPSEVDLKWKVTTPEAWTEHFEGGGPPVMTCSTIRLGGQFTLTPGTRQALKDRCGMTPTRTVTITLLDFFPGTKVVDKLTIRSNQHIPQGLRRHILVSYTITDFGAFMEAAKTADTKVDEVREERAKAAPKESVSNKNKVSDLTQEFI